MSCSKRIRHPAGALHRPPLPDTAAARLRAACDAMKYADVARETDPVALAVGTAAAAAATTAGEAAAISDDAAAAAAAAAAAGDTGAAAVACSVTSAGAATAAPWAATMAQTAAETGCRGTTQKVVRMTEESELTDPSMMYVSSITPLQNRTGHRSIRRP